MEHERITIEDGDFSLWAHAHSSGDDWSISIGGGTKSHIGAVAIGLPRPSLADARTTSSSISSICVPGHKDDEVARNAALRLSSTLNCVVVVSCGIHVDNASNEDIKRIMTNYDELIESLILYVKKA
ncbi:MAG: hypothetical protein ACOYD7_07175 [Raoultibacter sp.]|jgi:hypothetical protein